MDEKKSEENEFQGGFPDSSQNDHQRRGEASRKSTLVMNTFDPIDDDDSTCGERIASFLVAGNFTEKDDRSKHYSKEAFHPSRPILWTRGKNKARGDKAQNSQTKPYYSDMVIRRAGNDLRGAKTNGNFAQRTRNQRPTLEQPNDTHNTDLSSREECNTEKKKAISHKRCFEVYDPTAVKDEKYHASFSCSDRASIPRMRSEREDISSIEKKHAKDLKGTSPEDENQEKSVTFKGTTVSKKERTNQELKKRTISGPKALEKECNDSERNHRVNAHKRTSKSAKFSGTAKDPGRKKMAKTTTSTLGKDELMSKSENHVSAAFTGHRLPGRIPGTYSLIDIEKLKQKHSGCCRECLEARARSARPVRSVVKKDDAKKDDAKMTDRKPTGLDNTSSEEQLESSIVFFRNALNAVDLLEKLFQNIGNTKEFLQNVYDGLEESSDVARCRRNMTETRPGDEDTVQPKPVPKNESKKQVTSEKQEEENKKKVVKPKRKDHNKTKFKSSIATGQSSDNTSLKQEQKTKPKRDRDRNLLELSDEWKKRNHSVKP